MTAWLTAFFFQVVATAGMLDNSAGQGMAENTELLRACYAFLFFGVPNSGLNHDSLRTLVEGRPNDRLIHDLIMDKDNESSPLIRALDASFKNCFTLINFSSRLASSYGVGDTGDQPLSANDASRKMTRSGSLGSM